MLFGTHSNSKHLEKSSARQSGPLQWANMMLLLCKQPAAMFAKIPRSSDFYTGYRELQVCIEGLEVRVDERTSGDGRAENKYLVPVPG
jgi:hypothetical protein